jgi:hypothetical protein
MLREYGPQTERARGILRSYTAGAIASTWPGEPAPPGDYYPQRLPKSVSDTTIESTMLGDMLTSVGTELRRLEAYDAMHRRLLADSLSLFERLLQRRWKLIEEAHGSISVPFYAMLVFWLVVVFASFGLNAPRNLLAFSMIALGALSIASAIYVILDLDTPFTGIFIVSSEPLRHALAHMNR